MQIGKKGINVELLGELLVEREVPNYVRSGNGKSHGTTLGTRAMIKVSSSAVPMEPALPGDCTKTSKGAYESRSVSEKSSFQRFVRCKLLIPRLQKVRFCIIRTRSWTHATRVIFRH